MIIRQLRAVASGKNLVLIKVEERILPHEVINFYQKNRIMFPSENAIADPNQYAFSRKKGYIYQPVLLDGKIHRVLVLRKENEKFRWKEITISESTPFENCFLLGLAS